jgi:hypothetical protein
MLSSRKRAVAPRILRLGSAGASHTGFGSSPKRTFWSDLGKIKIVVFGSVAPDQSFAARRRKERAGRPRSP